MFFIRYTTILSCLLIVLAYNGAYTQTFSWAHHFGNSYWDEGKSIATDDQGNVYVSGHFEGTVDFDPTAGVFNLSSVDGSDVFVSKLSSEGEMLWTIQFGDSSYTQCNSLAVDKDGSVFVTGSFLGKVDFDPGIGSNELISSPWDRDIFILKLNTDGDFVWAKQISGISPTAMSTPSPNNSFSIAVDDESSSYITGYFDGQADFDPSPSDTFLLNVVQQSDIFICKLDSVGDFVWAKQIGGTQGGVGYSIAVNADSEVYTTGTIGPSSTYDFDPGIDTFNLSASDQFMSEIFVNKLDSLGNFVWAKTLGQGEGSAITVSENGTAYSSGWYPSGTTPVVNKFNASGNLLWSKNLGGINGKSLTLDSHENLYITGACFSGSHDFDPGLDTFYLTAGVNDAYISKLDSSGNFIWAGLLEAQNQVFTNEITVDINNNLYATGYFDQTADFDLSSSVHSLTSNGSYDIFVVSLSESFSTFEDKNDNQIVQVYPNPTENNVHVQGKGVKLVKIYDLQGRLINSQKVNDHHSIVELPNQSGLYLLKITLHSGESKMFKIVRE